MAFPVNAPTSPSRLAAATGRTSIVRVDEAFAYGVSPDARRAQELLSLELKWWAAAPLRSGGRVVGSISVAGRQGTPQPIIGMLERVGDQAGGLVATARLVEDLRRAQRRLQSILGALTDAVAVSDADGRVVYANRAAVGLLGAGGVDGVLDADDVGARFAITDEHGQPIAEHMLSPHRRQAGDEAAPVLTRAVDRVTGRSRWIRTRSSRLDEGPLVVHVMQDVTALREAELRRATALLEAGIDRDVVGALAVAVLIQRPGEGIVYANQAAAEAMGMASPQDVIAATPEQIAEGWQTYDEHGVPLDADRYPSRRILEGEREVEPLTVRTINCTTGREYWRLVRARPVLDEAGELVMAVSMTEDITQARRAILTQRLLAEAGRVLSSSLDYAQTLQELARLAVPELADWCSVAIPDEHGMIRTVAVAHDDPQKVRFARDYGARYAANVSDEGGAAEILRGGPGILMAHVPDALLREHIKDAEQLQLLRGIGMRSVIQVPIAAPPSAPIGVLSLINAESGRVFGDADLVLAEELGRRAGTAVQNARLHAERSHIAAILQQSLLPDELPRIDGYELSCRYRPAGEENWVGGDFYDVFAVAGGWMMIVGDVAGHGAPAAALTAQARHTLRAIGEASGDPAAAIAHLNRLLVPKAEPALVTVCGILLREDPRGDGAVATIVCAGHPLPYLARDGVVRAIGRPGPVLGAWASDFTAVDVPLGEGDILTVYTDGVLDTRAGPERFGEQRLVEALAVASGARDTVTRVQAALDAFQAGRQADDTAVLAIQRLRPGRAG